MKAVYSNYQPLHELFFLYVITLGLYFFWWEYKTWKQIKEANFDINFCKLYSKKKDMSNNISPIARTIFSIVPIVNAFIIYDLFKAIISYSEINKIEDIGTPMPLNFFLGYAFLHMFFLHIITILMIQDIFNRCWKKVDKRPISKFLF